MNLEVHRWRSRPGRHPVWKYQRCARRIYGLSSSIYLRSGGNIPVLIDAVALDAVELEDPGEVFILAA